VTGSRPSPPRRTRIVGACAALLLASLVVACGGSSKASSPVATTYDDATGPGAFGVGVTTLDLVDTSRSLDANGDFPGADERAITVEVWYPTEPGGPQPEARDEASASSGAPYPLIIFAHGFSGTRSQSITYTRHLASHGYIVAAPDFPGSNAAAPGGPRLSAAVDQPSDVSFVIDQLLALDATEGGLLTGAIDDETIGISGHSLGGLTTLLSIYGTSRDPRITAALPISPASCFLPETLATDEAVPILVIGGSADRITPFETVRYGYDIANAPKYLVELAGANHIRFSEADLDDVAITDFDQLGFDTNEFLVDAVRLDEALGGNASTCLPSGEPPSDEPVTLARQQELLRAFATPFFDAYLRDSDEALAFLQDELAELVPEATIESQLE
jgi:predicted dienelactone hydrolase